MNPLNRLPAPIAREILAALYATLPPPRDNTPEAREARDTIAEMALSALDPANRVEAMLAVRIVATEAHARACLQLAADRGRDVQMTLRCRAQAAEMMQQMHQALRRLQQMQAHRAKLHGTPPARRPDAQPAPAAAEPPPRKKPITGGQPAVLQPSNVIPLRPKDKTPKPADTDPDPDDTPPPKHRLH